MLTVDTEEIELNEDDGLPPSIAEDGKVHNVFSWNQLLDNDSLDADKQ